MWWWLNVVEPEVASRWSLEVGSWKLVAGSDVSVRDSAFAAQHELHAPNALLPIAASLDAHPVERYSSSPTTFANDLTRLHQALLNSIGPPERREPSREHFNLQSFLEWVA